MKISYNWLKSYVDIDLPAEDLANILTNTGLEVEEVEKHESIKGGLEGLIVGEVMSVEKHPNADKLVVTKTNIGTGEDLQIVCGAPNVAEGQKVIVAPVGVTIYPIEGEPFKIRKAKIRGEESYGMICAEDEIGLGMEHDGIMVLNGNTVAGNAVKEYFEVENDIVFEIGLTPNRSDAMSHIGVARDIVAAMNSLFDAKLTLKQPDNSKFAIDNAKLPIEVVVEDNEACPRYSGISISGVSIEASPKWMQNRLNAIGVRPINNIVDITNYVLHEYGQPLHAFDADKISGNKVIVKQLSEGSQFLSLDEVERKLSGEDLMICNTQEGMCIAGVFGGIKSGVTENTKNVFLESAFFNPLNIRRTSTRHQLRTEAASHFEKGTDPSMTVEILKRTALLMKDLAGGEISSEIIDIYPKQIAKAKVDFSLSQLDSLAGVKLERNIVKDILKDLDIDVIEENDDSWQLEVATYRTDVVRKQDVIEEILRIFGYNQIPIPKKLNTSIIPGGNVQYKKEQTLADLFRANGFHELFSNSISRSSYYNEKELEETVVLANSMTAQLDILRSNMLYGGLEILAYNKNRQNNQVKLFEFGNTYHRKGDDFSEMKHIALFVSGNVSDENWDAERKIADFYYLKGIIHEILMQFGVDKWNTEVISGDSHISEGVSYLIKDKPLLKYGNLNKATLKKAGIKTPVYYADIMWDLLMEKNQFKKIRFKEIPKFPFIRRDLALMVDESVQFSEIEQVAKKLGKNILQEVNLFDVYRGKNLKEGKKSYAVSYVFQDSNRTLTDEEVDKLMNSMISQYEDQLKAEIR